MIEVIIYSTMTCPYCVHAKSLLDSKGVKYTEIKVDEDIKQLEEMKAKSNNRTSVPQIFIAGKHIGGFTDLKALNESGELDKLLS